jgi:hypothetical protein
MKSNAIFLFYVLLHIISVPIWIAGMIVMGIFYHIPMTFLSLITGKDYAA